jgi:sortase A
VTSSNPDRRRRRLGTLLALLGAGLLLVVAQGLWTRWSAQREARSVLQLAPAEDNVDVATPPPDDGGDAPAVRARRPEAGSVVGRIRIASAGVDVVALEGVGDDILRRAAGHFPGTALPGARGNASFAAHRDSFFRGLRDVGVGDAIELETPEGAFLYRVSETRVVEPEAVEVVASRGRDELTLITCFPFDYVGPAPRRFVVHADLVGS